MHIHSMRGCMRSRSVNGDKASGNDAAVLNLIGGQIESVAIKTCVSAPSLNTVACIADELTKRHNWTKFGWLK
jgi:hypothetical protein